MDRKQLKKELEKLKKEITKHDWQYYVLDNPEISDAAYDTLKDRLEELEEKHPDLKTSDSPTQRVGGYPLDKFSKLKHTKPMFSMDDAFEFEEVDDWKKRISKILGKTPEEYFVELKMDGLAIELIYEKGVLNKAITRGDGRVGEDVTNNVKTIKEIPLNLSYGLSRSSVSDDIKNKILNGRLEIRGEIYLNKNDFERINKERKEKEESLYANPRNLAAGTIRQLDPKIPAKRRLRFNIYEIATELGLEKHSEVFKLASELGFSINKYAKKIKFIDSVKDLFKKWQDERESLPYQVDGVVIKVDDLSSRGKLGSVGKNYRWEIAYKWPAEQATTRVKNILIQVGRTGALTPVAALEPVKVAGSTVSRATLHNEDEVHRKDIRVGDMVVIQKAGDVIPEIVKSLKRLRPKDAKKFIMPKNCPVCGGKVVRKEGEVIHRCMNLNCSTVIVRRIIHFVSKKAFDMDGLGEKIIKQLIDEGLIRDSVDLFKLKAGDLTSLERFAEKSAQNVYESIQNSKKISLDRFIYSLSIPIVGVETAIDLAKQFGSLEKFRKASFEELKNMYGLAEKSAREIFDWLNDSGHQKFIDGLLKIGIEVKKYHSPIQTNKLKGKKFVVTGILPKMTREEAHKKIIQYGGQVNSSVSNKIDFLVAGENAGSKLEKAKKNNVKIISEKDLMEMLE